MMTYQEMDEILKRLRADRSEKAGIEDLRLAYNAAIDKLEFLANRLRP